MSLFVGLATVLCRNLFSDTYRSRWFLTQLECLFLKKEITEIHNDT